MVFNSQPNTLTNAAGERLFLHLDGQQHPIGKNRNESLFYTFTNLKKQNKTKTPKPNVLEIRIFKIFYESKSIYTQGISYNASSRF